LVTMDLDFEEGTVAADAAAAIAATERQVRERYPMIKRLFIEAGAAPSQQRWTRPDSTQAPPDPTQGPPDPTQAPPDSTQAPEDSK
jgi:hypothetical protein